MVKSSNSEHVSKGRQDRNKAIDAKLLQEFKEVQKKLRDLGISANKGYRLTGPFERSGNQKSSFEQHSSVQQARNKAHSA